MAEETEGWAENDDDGDGDGGGERGKKKEDRCGRNTEDCGGDGPRHRHPDRRAARTNRASERTDWTLEIKDAVRASTEGLKTPKTEAFHNAG